MGKTIPPKGMLSTELTAKEQEILLILSHGVSNKEIADRICRSVKTVEKHLSNIMRKLDIHKATGLTRYAVEAHQAEICRTCREKRGQEKNDESA